MSTISTVAVDFIANTAKYVAGLATVSNNTKRWANDTKKETQSVDKSFANLSKSIQSISTAFRALGAIAAGGALFSIAKQITDAASQLEDLSDQLGISTENLQRLESIFQKSGVTLEDVTAIYSRLQKAGQDAADGNNNLRQAFAELGISVEYFNRLRGEEKLEVYATALNKIEDPARKASLALELTGRSSGKALAGLREIAEKGSIKNATDGVIIASDQATKSLDRFGDRTTEVNTALKRLGIEGLSVVADKFLKAEANIAKGLLRIREFLGLPGIKAPAQDIQAAIDAFEKRTKAEQDNAAAIAEAQKKINDAFLSNVDPAARYRTELAKLREEAAKNKIPSEILAQRERALTEEFQKQTREIELNKRSQERRIKETLGLLETGPGGTSPFAPPTTENPFFTPGQIVQLDIASKKLKEIATFPSTADQIGAQIATEKTTKALIEEYNEIKKISVGLIENTRTFEESYAIQVAEIEKASTTLDEYGKPLIDAETKTRALARANQDLWEKTNPQIMQAFEFMSSFADQFSRAIVEGQNFGDALKNVFKSILRDITALIIRTTILQGIMAAIGIIAPDSGAAAAFGRMTGLIPRANGGNVMAGEAYMVGEKGPEAFVPTTNGVILPNDFQGGGETINFVQNISIETGVSQTVRAEMLGLLPRFKQEAMAGVLDAKQRGGSYAKGLAAA